MSLKGQRSAQRRFREGRGAASIRSGTRNFLLICWSKTGSLYGSEWPAEEIPEALVTARPREMAIGSR